MKAEETFPLYNSPPGDLVFPGPYHFENSFSFIFMVQADNRALQNVCNTWVNRPTGQEVVASPYFPYVFIYFIYYPEVWTLAQSPLETGVIQYSELVVAVPMSLRGNTCWEEMKLYNFMAYLLLDHPRAIVTGREVFGMPKVYGEIEFPLGTAKPTFAATTNMVKKFQNNYSQATEKRVLEITCPPYFNVNDYLSKKTSTDISHVRSKMAAGGSGSSNLSYRDSTTATNSMKSNYLTFKQVRNYLHQDAVSYKALLEYQTQNYTIKAAGVLDGKFSVRFPDYSELFPLREALGLFPKVTSAFWLKASFDLYMGKELWNPNSSRI